MVYSYHGIAFSFKRNEAVTQAMVWTGLGNTTLKEISRAQKTTYCALPLREMSTIVKPTETEDGWLPRAGWGAG